MNDLRFAFRQLLKNPGFTAVAVLTLALGIGANTAIFSAVNALVLQPLPYKDPDQIVQIFSQNEKTRNQSVWNSPPDFLDLKTQSKTLEAIAGWRAWDIVDRQDDEPVSIKGAAISANLFDTLGVQPFLGRTIVPEEAQATNSQVVILSHGFWQRRFAADPKIIGKTVWFSDKTYTVVGVTAPDFKFPTEPTFQWEPDLLVPLWFSPERDTRNSSSIHVFARLRPGANLGQAQAEVNTIATRLAQQYPASNTNRGMYLMPLHESLEGQVRPALLILFGAVSFVLLIACANVANLLLARAASRSRETAVRFVLGASHARLLRQFLTESLLLSCLGGIGGLLVAGWVLTLLVSILPQNFPRIVEIHIDPWVLGFTAVIALLTGLVSGAAPVFQTAKTNLPHSLKEEWRAFGSSPRSWFRDLLVIAEVALSLVLLVGAGLLIKSYWVVTHVDLGFNSENVLSVSVSPWGSKYRSLADYYAELFQRVKRLPGVESLAVVDLLPLLNRSDSSSSFTIEGHSHPPSGNDLSAHMRGISSEYFHVLQIPVMEGRQFTEQDTEQSQKVVMINQALARRFFEEGDPIGQLLNIGGEGPRIVVGVVGDVKPNGFESLVVPEVYFPYTQFWGGGGVLLVRTAAPAKKVASNLRAEVLAINRTRPVDTIRPLEQILAGQVALRRFNAILLGSFGALGLVIAIVGIYGVISYSVSRRTHELGVRMALGAQTGDVIKLVVKQGMTVAVVGAAIGLAGALAITRVMSTLLYEVKPTDTVTYAGLSLLLVSVAWLACFVPARRAAKVDPMEALRYE